MSERHGTREDRPMDEPAPTVTGKSRSDEWVYVNGNQENAARRPIDAPAPTVMFGHKKNEVSWTRERPATTVTADPDNSIPVTVEQAAALQSFPPDHPWQGSKTKQHEQVGNAVPPLMARVILEALRPHTPKESE